MDAMEQALLNKIGEARFACVELRLYLDTHPDDATAKADYLAYSVKLQQLIDQYEQQCGPLINFGPVADRGRLLGLPEMALATVRRAAYVDL